MLQRIDPSARTVLMLVNRTAGPSPRKQIAEEAQAALRNAGFTVQRIDSPEALSPASKELQQRGQLRCVIAVGGDGTLGAALNNTPAGTPLTILPAGTENLLAGYLHLNRRPSDLVRLVRGGLTLRLDAGIANGRRFSLMASAGFDAEVVRRVHARRMRTGGNIDHFSYARPILGAMGRYGYPPLRVTGQGPGGEPIDPITGCWLFGLNLPRYASGLGIAPRASGLDGLLDLCVLGRGQAAAGLWYLWHIVRRRHQHLPSVATPRVARCRIESVDGRPVPYQLDGDPGGMLPLDLSVERGALRVLVTPSTARRLVERSAARG